MLIGATETNAGRKLGVWGGSQTSEHPATGGALRWNGRPDPMWRWRRTSGPRMTH